MPPVLYGNSEVRALSVPELDPFLTIVANAYPGMNIVTADDRRRWLELLKSRKELPNMELFGAFRDKQLVGGMILYDFKLNIYGHIYPAGGIGLVAVDLLHKKEKIARDLVTYFLDHYRTKGVNIVLLYPFRPDFYKRMGFGYGTKMNSYRFRASALPSGNTTTKLAYLSKEDLLSLVECYNLWARNRHGMILRDDAAMLRVINRPERRVIGYRSGDRLLGYLVLSFENKGSFLQNDLRIVEWISHGPMSLREMCAFLRRQYDQFEWVQYTTQEEGFHHLLYDPRNDSGELIPSVYHESNRQGVGLMYRVVNTPGILTTLPNRMPESQTYTIRYEITDSLVPENSDTHTVRYEAGGSSILVDGLADVTVKMNVSEFSSMVMGVASFQRLYELGFAEISDPSYIGLIHRHFFSEVKPVCMTEF